MDYLNLAKSKKRTIERIRETIKQQLQYTCRDRDCIEALLGDGCKLTVKQLEHLEVVDKVAEQQEYVDNTDGICTGKAQL